MFDFIPNPCLCPLLAQSQGVFAFLRDSHFFGYLGFFRIRNCNESAPKRRELRATAIRTRGRFFHNPPALPACFFCCHYFFASIISFAARAFAIWVPCFSRPERLFSCLFVFRRCQPSLLFRVRSGASSFRSWNSAP